jgi:hypothetical protein
MSLVEQWKVIQSNLPEGWTGVQLRLTAPDEPERAAAMLAPAGAGRHGNTVTFGVGRGGVGSSPDLVRRLLARLDAERLRGSLALARPVEGVAPAGERSRRALLGEQWELLLSELPEDWSDLYAEIEFASSDYLDPGALLMAPVNPSRVPDRLAFRFRAARRFGYGASPEMTRRCFERLDEESIRGTVRIEWALSDTRPVYTQGPVWYAGGRAV